MSAEGADRGWGLILESMTASGGRVRGLFLVEILLVTTASCCAGFEVGLVNDGSHKMSFQSKFLIVRACPV